MQNLCRIKGTSPIHLQNMVFEVPADSYFVMGDNRNASTDSRRQSIGAIEKEDIMGRVVLRLYPFSDIGMVK